MATAQTISSSHAGAQSDPVVFKILSGVQSGVEVTLADGDYAIGTGPADDIHLIDVSLLPGHARLRLAGAAMEIAAGEGALRTSSGDALEPKGPFHALAPLTVVTAGTTRFALGPRSANWASVSDEGAGGAPGIPQAETVTTVSKGRDRLRVLAVPLLALAVLLGIAGWLAFGAGLRSNFHGHDGAADVSTVRAALDAFPFGRPITVRREVDGAVFVEGYVDTPVERRALAGALERTDVPARVRLWVLQSMRADIGELIGAEKVDVGFDLSHKGQLALSGVILDKARAEAFVSQIRDRVFGIAAIESGIRTGDTLLADVRKLVATSGLQPWLILRLDRNLIEVDGALPSDKVDVWVGFLQSYADKYSKLIALRSFVQLQGENGRLVPAPTGALVMGSAKVAAGDNALDLAKLQNGRYDIADVLVSSSPLVEKRSPGAREERRVGPGATPAPFIPGQPLPAAADPATPGQPQPAAANPATPGGRPQLADSGLGRAANGTSLPNGAASRSGSPSSVPPPGSAKAADVDAVLPRSEAQEAAKALGDRAAALMRRFKDGTLSTDPGAADLYQSLVLLGNDGSPGAGDPPRLPDWYLPLLSGVRPTGANRPCWPGAQLDDAGIMSALFWLDILSASRSQSVAALPRAQELAILEAALDPAGVAACARRSPEAARAADHSLYLREVRRNPGFVRFVARDVPDFSLDVAGVSLGSDRFLLTQAGDRLFEGAAPDRGSRLALIGELGLIVQTTAGLSALIFGPNIDWLVSN